jgi:hypothetical protein
MVKESNGDSTFLRRHIFKWKPCWLRGLLLLISLLFMFFQMLFLLIDEWGDFLPRFREHRDDNPVENLLEFHELMHQWGIHHEDELMNMLMYLLEGDAHEWY